MRHVVAGAAEFLPLMRARNLARIMREIKERGIFLVGTSDQAQKSLYDANYWVCWFKLWVLKEPDTAIDGRLAINSFKYQWMDPWNA